MRSIRELHGWRIGAVDGDVGHLADVYFDDYRWAVRHLVVETGGWPLGRRVLVSPQAVRGIDAGGRRMLVDLCREEVALGPDVDLVKPVSRQHQMELSHYYGFPSYAVAAGASVMVASSMPVGVETVGRDRHLRSARAIAGYYVHALDDDAGHVEDWLVDDGLWMVRYLIVSVRNWPTRLVPIPVGWITGVSWGAGAVRVSLPAETIRLAPGYEHASSLGAEQASRVARYYGPPPFGSG